MNGRGYKDLIVWQKSVDFAEMIYKTTSKFPQSEMYGLVSQLRRASVSIPSNIAEGSKRKPKDQIPFLRIAFGSGSEIETKLELCRRFGYIGSSDYNNLEEKLSEIMKILSKLIFNKSSNI